jgi:hypothetical protein
MIASMMKCRWLRLANRPILVILSGTEKQIKQSFRYLYLMGNLLAPEKLDTEGKKSSLLPFRQGILIALSLLIANSLVYYYRRIIN